MKIILYMATSKNGFIADEKGGVDWLPTPESSDLKGEDCGYNSFLDSIEVIFMGRKSFNQMLTFGEWPYKDKITYVFSSSKIINIPTNCFVTNLSIPDFLKKHNFKNKNIWLFGGAKLAYSFDQLNLIDQMVITIIPISIPKGIPLNIQWEKCKLIENKKFIKGIEQNIYILN